MQFRNLNFVFQKFFIWKLFIHMLEYKFPFSSKCCLVHVIFVVIWDFLSEKFYGLNLKYNFFYFKYLNTYLLIHDHENRMPACSFSLKYLCETSLYKSILREFRHLKFSGKYTNTSKHSFKGNCRLIIFQWRLECNEQEWYEDWYLIFGQPN